MFDFGKRDSRKFIDLLLKSTNKWINIDVGKEIRVGDFGTIDPATGEFMIDGNLYEAPETKAIMENYPVTSAPVVGIERFTSNTVKELGFSPKVSVGVETIINTSLDASWEFGRKRSAILLLLSASVRYMRGFPSSAIIGRPDVSALLKKKVICTDVTSCPAFCLYLSNSCDHTFRISFNAEAPIVVAPGINAGGGLGTNWKVQGAQGIVKEGVNTESVFHPLFSLKAINWGRIAAVTRGEANSDEPISTDVEAPWEDLDDDGEQMLLPQDSGEDLD